MAHSRVLNSFYYKTMILPNKFKPRDVHLWLIDDAIDYTIVPILIREHWFFVVICHAHKVLARCFDKKSEASLSSSSESTSSVNIIEREYKNGEPCLLVFDSLKREREDLAEIAGKFRRYLTKVGKYRQKKMLESEAMDWDQYESVPEVQYTEMNMPHFTVKVPIQPNSVDCGVFLLRNILLFGLKKGQIDVSLNCINWYSKMEGEAFRYELLAIVRGYLSVKRLISQIDF